jgi:hypothetical protein
MGDDMTEKKNDVKNEIKSVDAAYLPKGYREEDFKDVGGFTPIYKPKNAYTNKWAPVLGWVVNIEVLPTIEAKREDQDDFTPLQARVILCAPNKGVRGPRTKEEIFDLGVGEEIFVPLSGNLLYNRPLMVALFDPKNVHLARFTVTGQMPMDLGDMWTWRVQMNSQTKERTGTFIVPELRIPPEVVSVLTEKQIKALPQTAFMREARMLPMGRTAAGHVYDKDGVLQERAS